MKCYKGTYDIYKGTGECPEECEYGAWNNGICGAQCLKCGDDLYLNEDGKVICAGCGISRG